MNRIDIFIPYIVTFIAYVVIMNIIAAVQYYRDKKRAENNQWRIRESNLLLIGLLGSIGALIAMKKFHHKTKKWYFWAVNIIGLVLEMAISIFILVLIFISK